MAVPKPHDGPTADKNRDWNWSEEKSEELDALLDHGDWKAVRQAHAWNDDSKGDPPPLKTAYKLPHHELIDGEIKVVWRGVAHAMNVLRGGRGGVKIPDDEKDAVYRHLAKHYEQFDEDPPDGPR